ncbi:helix-turn-helix domain-containing protein [Psychroflexus sediminis]|uniref:Helix-turn-helix domain-containing protein n=1 Tax=Psychroflexus sediminis TaxID=470826 RepID=A0A1G7UMD1_9FLAO|nr:helix-turn-helix transcriptional regulator [Psychroflexus sediminis]SDG47870.1 Helix-turn-helix domain-containing protein [Psychroflexus sediminis]
MEIIKVLKNIERVRKNKYYSHDYMAICLDISQAAYSKIERNQTKLSVERLFKIAEILEVELEDLLETGIKYQFTQASKENLTAYLQRMPSFQQESKDQLLKIIDLYEERIKDKDHLIRELQLSLEQLRLSN